MIDQQDYEDLKEILQLLAGIISRQELAKAEREALLATLKKIPMET